MAASFDLLVIGADEASLSAAAAAARSGVATALLRSPKQKNINASYCHIPNFVWRRLDLHEYGLAVEPVAARVTLTPDGGKKTTFQSVRETNAKLAKDGSDDKLMWPDFVEEMKGLDEARALQAKTTNIAANGAASSIFGQDLRSLSAMARAMSACVEILNDYFEDKDLKTHVAAHALSMSGLGGAEPGSALALTEFFDENAWRVRPSEDSPSLLSTLETACRDSGVEFIEKELEGVEEDNGKHRTIALSGGEKIKTRIVLFASPGAAQGAGVRASISPLNGQGGAKAQLRISLKSPMPSLAAGESTIFQIVDGIDDLQSARDSVVDGRLPASLPVQFEVTPNGDILAQTSYCPAAFREEDGWREWTGQDRQAITRLIIDQLSSRIPGFAENVRKSKLTVTGAESPDRPPVFVDLENIIVQPSRHNAVAEAVRLIDKVFAGE